MKKSELQTLNQETPLLPPILTPMYPFKHKLEHFVEGCGDYILREDAYMVLEKTIGIPVNKSKLKVFLAKECNIPDPTNYSFPDIIAALQLFIKLSTGENNELLSDRQLEVWDLLKGKALSAKELGKSLDLSAENIRKHIQAIRNKHGQKAIENTRSRGYWRPDDPPPDGVNKT